jgi:nitrogen fixation-related uncharacterized protein
MEKFDKIARSSASIMFVAFATMLFVWGLKKNQRLD